MVEYHCVPSSDPDRPTQRLVHNGMESNNILRNILNKLKVHLALFIFLLIVFVSIFHWCSYEGKSKLALVSNYQSTNFEQKWYNMTKEEASIVYKNWNFTNPENLLKCQKHPIMGERCCFGCLSHGDPMVVHYVGLEKVVI